MPTAVRMFQVGLGASKFQKHAFTFSAAPLHTLFSSLQEMHLILLIGGDVMGLWDRSAILEYGPGNILMV